MDYAEKWGKDVEIATELALKELKLTREEVNIIVIEEPSNGFLGIGSKLAKVRVEKKKADSIEDIKEGSKAEKNIEVKDEEKKDLAEEPVKEKHCTSKAKEGVITRDYIKSKEGLKEIETHETLDFLKETTDKMGLELTFKAYMGEDSLYIDIDGKDASGIIGKRGVTLDAIQYLASLVANKEREGYLRVVLDAKNYRQKREETLIGLANRLARKVLKTGRYVKLEPMNPYERMVIHAAVQDIDGVITRSEGEEPYRKVVIDIEK